MLSSAAAYSLAAYRASALSIGASYRARQCLARRSAALLASWRRLALGWRLIVGVARPRRQRRHRVYLASAGSSAIFALGAARRNKRPHHLIIAAASLIGGGAAQLGGINVARPRVASSKSSMLSALISETSLASARGGWRSASRRCGGSSASHRGLASRQLAQLGGIISLISASAAAALIVIAVCRRINGSAAKTAALGVGASARGAQKQCGVA